MALATFRDLCLDVHDAAAQARFWGPVLGLDVGADGASLRGPTRQHTLWLQEVPEPKTIKDRVHLDVRAPSLELFAGLTRLSEPGEFPWTVLADPEGHEFCVFVDESVDRPRLKDVVLDAHDARAVASWWAEVFGVPMHDDSFGHYLSGLAGSAFEDLDIGAVPEPKTVKNRLHWDVNLTTGSTVDDLVSMGARVLREPDVDHERRWTVLADPEGNEFCAFGADA